MEKICKNCKHFNNERFDNKHNGVCEKLNDELMIEDHKGKAVRGYVITHENFGCVKFEKKTK